MGFFYDCLLYLEGGGKPCDVGLPINTELERGTLLAPSGSAKRSLTPPPEGTASRGGRGVWRGWRRPGFGTTHPDVHFRVARLLSVSTVIFTISPTPSPRRERPPE